jgi:DNA-directed RNA polymerase II subunit RPB2
VWTGNSRARGPKQTLTRQPLEGRARDGGLRIGEMERDVIIAHGMSNFLKERYMDSSDAFDVRVCDKCGFFAHKKRDKDIYICMSCNNSVDISKIRIPYAMKQLVQELISLGIAPRIRVKKTMYNDVNIPIISSKN